MTKNIILILKSTLLIAITALILVLLYMHAPIAQSLAYHNFADHRILFGIPNYENVLSNIPFCLIGIWALLWLYRDRKSNLHFVESKERYFYWVLFAGVFLVGFGSGYYHLHPDNQTLVWDRLPMTIGFMSLLAAMIGERVNWRLGLWLLTPLLVLGFTSVIFWRYTELWGHGDLRLYYFVQGFPMLVIPLLLLLFPARYTKSKFLWLALLFYLLAKITETYDRTIFQALGDIISGHTIKHLLAATASYFVYRYVRVRKKVET